MNTKSILYSYLEKNKKNFIILIIYFFVGMILGILFINNTNKDEMEKINYYVNSLIENMNSSEQINKFQLFFQSIKQNIIFVLLIWILGCTIIGNTLVYFGIGYKGFSLGYTISAIIASLGVKSGSVFVFTSLFLQNIIFLPALFILAESGIKLYRRITKQCMNLKQELLRHTIVMFICVIMVIVSSLIEVYLSTNLLIILKNFM